MLSKRKAAMKTAMGMASGTSPAARPSPVKRVVPKRSTLGRRGAAAAPPVAANSSEVPASPRPAAEPSKRRRGVQVPYHDSVRGDPMPLPGADAASDAEVSFADLSETRSGLESQMEAVVKVFCVHSEPNFSLPWQRKRQFSSSGSGFVISGRRILTNAHCVDHHTQVRVKRRGSDAKLVARVLAVGPECDVALLTVDDDAFWEGLEPVRLGPLPRLQDAVAVVGYPIGGDTMSVTSGVVSRIEVTSYVHGAAELLGVQVDAAINSGNSGGPAFGPGGECVGIAFQSLKHEDAENISYIIPTPVVEHFIRDYETHGAYTGFPSLGIEWQKMESPVMRRALGMAPDERGVLVRRVEPTSPLAPLLGQGDVLLSFDGVAIGSDGTVPFRFGERIGFNYLVSQKYTGDSAQLGVRRARRDGDSAKQSVGASCVRQLPVPKMPKASARGTSKTAASQPHASEVCLFELQLQAFSRLIPVHIDNRPPSYFIYGGLVFTPATVPLLRSEYGKEFDFDAPVKLLDKMMHAMAQSPGQQVIILSQVLAAEANVGYEDVVNTQVLAVDGQAVHSLRELVALVEGGPPREIIRFDLEYQQAIALDRAQVAAATADILRQHCIPADRSVDLLGGS